MENNQLAERPQEKPARYTAEQIAIMHEILDLAVNCPKGVADVFVNYSPHVDWLQVSAHVNEWARGKGCDWEFNAFMGDESVDRLISARDGLRQFIESEPFRISESKASEAARKTIELNTLAESLGMTVVPKGSHNE